MSGSREGGLKTVAAIKKKYGEDHYSRIGKIGGAKSKGGGFFNNPELARIAGSKGGRISRRTKHKLTPEQRQELELLRVALQEEAAVISY